MSKKIIFRVDGNSNLGLGHIFRCIALVEMLKKKYDFFFLTRTDSELKVISKHYNLILIPISINICDEPEWINEKYSYNEYIIIIDGYKFNSEYQKNLKDKGFGLVFIDDLAEEKIFADILINHSPNLSSKDFLKGSNKTKYALGLKYAILRPGFLNATKKLKKLKKINEIFICFGGVDNLDLTNIVLEGIIDILSFKKINIVLGASYSHEKIFNTVKKRTKDIFIYKNIDEKKMIYLMNKCQLAIVPSSTILYEICSVKMLVLSGYYVDNQIKINTGFELKKLIYNVGDLRKLQPNDFKIKVNEIISDTNKNHLSYINNQNNSFDGKQSERINKLISSIC